MDLEQSWQAIERERLHIAELLSGLTAQEWDRPSLCAGWRVRDVAAHLALAPQPPGTGAMLAGVVRCRGNLNRYNRELCIGYAAQRSGAQLVAELRAHASSRTLSLVTDYRNVLFDVHVHGQDIAVPLGREHPMPVDAAAAGADRVWAIGWPFRAKRRFADFTLCATDADWRAGSGPRRIEGPIAALLLLLTGRTALGDQLSGPWEEAP